MRTKLVHKDKDGPEDELIHEDAKKFLRTTQFMRTDLWTKRIHEDEDGPEDEKIHEDNK